MSNDIMVDLGRRGREKLGFNYEEETGFGLAGGSGTGKTNLAINVLTQLLDKKECLEVHILRSKGSFLYSRLSARFENIVVDEDRLHKVRIEVNNLVKELGRRKKLSDEELGKEVDKFVLFDDFSIMLINARKKYKKKWLDDFIGKVSILVNEGPGVGIKSMCVFLRNLEFDAPKVVVKGLSVLGVTMSDEGDYARWGLSIEGEKELSKNGDLYVRVGDFVGYVKTYNMRKYIEDKRGVFRDWVPYKEMNDRVFDILTGDVGEEDFFD